MSSFYSIPTVRPDNPGLSDLLMSFWVTSTYPCGKICVLPPKSAPIPAHFWTDRNLFDGRVGPEVKEDVSLLSEDDDKIRWYNAIQKVTWRTLSRAGISLSIMFKALSKGDVDESKLNQRLQDLPESTKRSVARSGVNTFLFSVNPCSEADSRHAAYFRARSSDSSIGAIILERGKKLYMRRKGFLAAVFLAETVNSLEDFTLDVEVTPGVKAGLLGHADVIYQTAQLKGSIDQCAVLMEAKGDITAHTIRPGESNIFDGKAILGVLTDEDNPFRFKYVGHEDGQFVEDTMTKEILGRVSFEAEKSEITVLLRSNPHDKHSPITWLWRGIDRLTPIT